MTRTGIFLLAILFFCATGVSSQDEGRIDLDSVRIIPTEGRAGTTILLEVTITPHMDWHIYGKKETNGEPPRLEFSSPHAKVAGFLDLPDGERHEAYGMESYWIHDTVTLKQKLTISREAKPGKVEVSGVLHYTACTSERCDPPYELPVTATFTVLPGAAVEAPVSDTAQAQEKKGKKKDKSLFAFLLLAIGAGLFALAMPCTYPMIPITISFFTKQANDRGGNVLPLSLTYGAGIVLIFVLIGVLVGGVIVPFAANPVVNLLIGVVFLFFGLALFGVITLQPPQFLLRSASKASQKGGYIGVFLMGATLVVTSFTCTAQHFAP